MVMFDPAGTTVHDDRGVRDCLYQAAREHEPGTTLETDHLRFPFKCVIHDEFDLDTVQAGFGHAFKSNAHRVGIRIP